MNEAAKKQVNTLLYCLEEQAETVLASMNITQEHATSLTCFFKVTRNTIFEWARFNCRVQLEGESVE